MGASSGSTAAGSGESRAVAVVVWLVGLGVFVTGAQRWIPPLASEHGAGIDRMIQFTLTTVGCMILLGHGLLGYFLWRYGERDRVAFRRASERDERRWSWLIAGVMAVVAEGGVLVLGLPVWAKVFGSTAPPDAYTVEVTPEQFAWNVRYAGRDGKFGRTDLKLISLDNPLGRDMKDPAGKDDIVDLNTIRVPVNRPVRIRLRSKDVIHSFFLPNFRVKQDAVPGMTIDVWFVPTTTGTFELACAELCGFGHYSMRGLLIVLPDEELNKWLLEQPHE